MSRDLFGLKDEPFSAYPDNKYFFSSISHDKAITLLEYGLNSRKGFMLLTGLKGTGKTMTCNILKNSVTNCNVSIVEYESYTADQLMKDICRGFGLAVENAERQELFGRIMEYFVEQYKAGHNNLIIIDRAENITDECLLMLSQFMEIEIEKCKLVQVIISGCPELHDRLRNIGGELGPKFTFTVELAPLTLQDTIEYVEHRIRTAVGDDDWHLFKSNSYSAIYEYSKGVPSEINRIAQKALEIAKEGKKSKITPFHIKLAAARLYGVRATRKSSKFPLILVVVIILFGVSYFYKDKIFTLVKPQIDKVAVGDIQPVEEKTTEPPVTVEKPVEAPVAFEEPKVEAVTDTVVKEDASVEPAPVVAAAEPAEPAVVKPDEKPVAEAPVKVVEEKPSSVPAPEPEAVLEVKHGCITAYSGLKVRSGPSVQSELMGTAPYMAYVELIELSADGKWWKAKFEGSDGYMYSKYINVVDTVEDCKN